jgi:hypothetical protein
MEIKGVIELVLLFLSSSVDSELVFYLMLTEFSLAIMIMVHLS